MNRVQFHSIQTEYLGWRDRRNRAAHLTGTRNSAHPHLNTTTNLNVVVKWLSHKQLRVYMSSLTDGKQNNYEFKCRHWSQQVKVAFKLKSLVVLIITFSYIFLSKTNRNWRNSIIFYTNGSSLINCNIQGYPQRMRLQRRQYSFYLVVLLTNYVHCNSFQPVFTFIILFINTSKKNR